MRCNNFCFSTQPNTGTIITADGVATIRDISVGNTTEEDAVISRGCVTFETKALSNSH